MILVSFKFVIAILNSEETANVIRGVAKGRS